VKQEDVGVESAELFNQLLPIWTEAIKRMMRPVRDYFLAI